MKQPWTFTTPEQRAEAVAWLETDAAYLRQCSTDYATKGDSTMAEATQRNAEHSAALAAAIKSEVAA